MVEVQAKIRCSFCGSQFSEDGSSERKIVAGTHATICDSCISTCVQLIEDAKATNQFAVIATKGEPANEQHP
jgi:ATP-dependent protease Clp ATPase subunit